MHCREILSGLVGTLGLMLACCVTMWGQPPASVTFEQNFPGSEPAHYIVAIASDCKATYQSDGKLSSQAEAEESGVFDFVVTPASCAKVFALTKRAHYFDGEIDSKRKNLASTGVKVLSYKDPRRNTRATYNYSPNPAVQELTDLFQSLGSTVEFGRRLEYDHHYQKLALDEDLKRLEDLSGKNQWQELSAISPTLQKIIDDSSLLKVVRVRAQRLLGDKAAN